MKSPLPKEAHTEAPAESGRLKTDLLNNVNHALRTPLTLVLGLLDEVLENAGEPLSPGQRAKLETAHRQAGQLSEKVDALLEIVRAQVESAAAGQPPADLATLAGQISGLLHPAAILPEPDQSLAQAPLQAQNQPAAPGLPHILVADDNADIRRYIERLLGAHYQITAVADGLEALDAARARRPDLVLTDVMMPRLDGLGLLGAIRQDERLRDLPVVVLSARAGDEARDEGIAAGADDYLAKPFSRVELLAVIKNNLTKKR